MKHELFTGIAKRLLAADHVVIYGQAKQAHHVFSHVIKRLSEETPTITIRRGMGNNKIELENGATLRTLHSENALRGLMADLFIALKPLSTGTELTLQAHGTKIIPVAFDH